MKNYQKEALQLAKNSILEEFWKASLDNYYPKNKELLEKKACFVTLKKAGDERLSLRWCIGSLVPTRELYLDIIDNAKNAAFNDPRFSPLTYEEVNDLFVEISILQIPYEVKFNSIEELLYKLQEEKPWLIIKLFWRQATFLPSVWEEIKDSEQFLIHLILKAWLNIEDFVQNFKEAQIFFYTTEEFWEKWKNI